jgi:hypothetical protein
MLRKYKLLELIVVVGLVGMGLNTAAEADVLAYWEFNDKAPGGTTTAGERINDSSSYNRDAYAGTGTSLPTYAAGSTYYGSTSAMNFTLGTDEAIFEAGHNFGSGDPAGADLYFGASDSFTMEAVIKLPVGSTGYHGIMFKKEDTYQSQFWWRIRDTGLQNFYIQGADSTSSSGPIGTVNLFDGKWHHIAAVRDTAADVTRIYIDYVLDKTTDTADNTAGSIANGGILTIGAFTGNDTREFNGDIDFIKISSGVLTPSQFIQKLVLPSNPSPSVDANVVPISANLSWTPISEANTTINYHTVYLATDAAFSNIVETFNNVTGSSVNPSLELDTKYYWRVDTDGQNSGVPFLRKGVVWSFTTPLCLITVDDGDFNGDCIVNMEDFAVIASNWLKCQYDRTGVCP